MGEGKRKRRNEEGDEGGRRVPAFYFGQVSYVELVLGAESATLNPRRKIKRSKEASFSPEKTMPVTV